MAVTSELPEVLTWQRKIPLITNPWLVLQCIVIPLLIGVFLGGFLWLITGQGDMLMLFLLIGVFLVFIFLLVMLVLQLATGGGLQTEFFISSEGVAHKAGSTTMALDRAATAGGVISGSITGTGAGLLAISQEYNKLRWADVRYVMVFRSVRSVVLRSKYLIGPVVLYCTEENFPVVLAMVHKFAHSFAEFTSPPSIAPVHTCQNCGNVLNPGARFCSECGRATETGIKAAYVVSEPPALKCPNCGNPLSPGNKFCGSCGHIIS